MSVPPPRAASHGKLPERPAARERRPIMVAGAGHWMIAHDRVGPRIVEMVSGRYPEHVEICDLGAGGLALLDELSGQELLLVVDACVGLGRPGEVRVVEPDLEAPVVHGVSVHQVGPVETLAVAAELWPERLPRRVRLVLVETEGLDADGERAACEEAVRLLDRQIEECSRSLNTTRNEPGRSGSVERGMSW